MEAALRPVFLILLAASAQADEPLKVLFPDELAAQNHKWEGRLIQTQAHCIYSDSKSYQCTLLSHKGLLLRVDFFHIAPADLERYVEKSCHTANDENSDYCSFRIRFVYMENEYVANLNTSPLLLIHAKDGTGVFSEPDNRAPDQKTQRASRSKADCSDPAAYKRPLEERTNCPILTKEQLDELRTSDKPIRARS
jgi:hypothetical protein